MTCIVGLIDKKNNNVIIGGDCAASANSNVFQRKDKKVFRNGEFVIGCTTSFRMIQLLQYSFIPPKINNKNIHKYMCTDFIDEVRKCFSEGGFLQRYQDGDEKGGSFLVGYKDRLFKIDSDFQVGENKMEYDSIGSGSDFALGSLFTSSNLEPKKRVIMALKSAEYLSMGVLSPFTILSTVK